MENDQVPENDLPCSITDAVISLVRDWKSISKDRSHCSKEKLICINNLEKITANFEGSTSACEENLKPLLNIMKEGLADGDPFVRYSAAKVYGNTVIRCIHCQADFTQLLQDIISSLPNIAEEYRVSIIDLLWHQTSKFLTEDQWLVLITVMGQYWTNMCKSCLFDFLCELQYEDSSNSCANQKRDTVVVLCCQFLHLWKRMIKKCTTNTTKNDYMEFLQPVINLIQLFRSKTLNVDRMTFRPILKLILVVVKNMDKIANLGSDYREMIVQIADEFMHCCSTEFFEEFPRGFKEGFAGELIVNPENQDLSILRIMASICIKFVVIIPKLGLNSIDITGAFAILNLLDTWMSKTLALQSFSWVPMVYSEQDDAWIDILRTLLEIYTEGEARIEKQKGLSDVLAMIKPHKQFLLFLDNTGFDETLVVDLLISPETCFLSYFTKYLRVVASEWTEFAKTHSEYSCHGSLDSRCGSQDSVHAERMVNTQNAKKTANQRIDTGNAANSSKAEGLTMLQQYGFDDDDDDDEDDGEDDAYSDEKVEDYNYDDDICKDDEEEESRVKSVTADLSCSSFNDHFHSDTLDLQSANISSCLDKTMAVLIRVRLKMEKFIDSSILQYNPHVLVHLIEQVEKLYEQ